MMPPDGRCHATERPCDSSTASAGYSRGDTHVSFRWPASVYASSSSSRRYLTIAVVVLVIAIVGSLGAIILRSGAATEADASIVELRRSLP